MRLALLLAMSAQAWASSDGAWTMTFRYPQEPVMLPSRCSTTCLRRQPKPWTDHWANPKPNEPAPQPPIPRPDGPAFVSGTPEKPAIDDFQEWRKSDPGVLKRRAQEQREQANEVLRNALDGNVPRPTRKEPMPEEDE